MNMINKFIKSIEKSNEYNFILDNYKKFSKSDLMTILLRYIDAIEMSDDSDAIRNSVSSSLEIFSIINEEED